MRLLNLSLVLLLSCARAPEAAVTPASSLEHASPEGVGMSSTVLDSIAPIMQQLIDSRRTGGIMTLVARSGRIVHWEAVGDRIPGEPLEPNDIFRIFSMTKPITSAAAMMLVEAGQLQLEDPVSKYIPSFADVQVYEPGGGRRPPARAMTVKDLLTHTSGLTYGLFGETPVDSVYRASGLFMAAPAGLAGFVEQVAALPLLGDPGAVWNYGVSTDILGRVIEVASGQPLDVFFRERIFEPLGMDDTGFEVPADQVHRFTAVYAGSGDDLAVTEAGGASTSPPVWLSGGGGLASTAADYLRFCQMLLNEGELDGVRILRPETVRAMRSNQIPESLIPIAVGPRVLHDYGFGLGFAAAVDGPLRGTFYWGGAANTHFWIDPAQEIIGFAWTQFVPFGGVQIDPVLRRLVYASLRGSGG
ncbi:MAG TPA: serine hydrolase domain-containing protein [Thermoanaerobaculia bacterium]|nr:serine hydrolase domain-containing protein [Thermoanaerobaculia bacterium]